jgi:hypothetical protein
VRLRDSKLDGCTENFVERAGRSQKCCKAFEYLRATLDSCVSVAATRLHADTFVFVVELKCTFCVWCDELTSRKHNRYEQKKAAAPDAKPISLYVGSLQSPEDIRLAVKNFHDTARGEAWEASI